MMQSIALKKLFNTTINFVNKPRTLTILRCVAILAVTCVVRQVFAVDSDDLFNGTEKTLIATIQGTGKKYLYIGECIISLLVYIQTKNIMYLLGIVVVAIFVNIMLTMVGAK